MGLTCENYRILVSIPRWVTEVSWSDFGGSMTLGRVIKWSQNPSHTLISVNPVGVGVKTQL